MKILTIVAIAVAFILFPFRKKITKATILSVFRDPVFLTRLAYVGIAILWLFNAQDADRIHVSSFWYSVVPSGILLLYVVYPIFKIWLLVLATLFVGWGLHMHRSLEFQILHLGIKTDVEGLVTITLMDISILLLGVGILYLFGPCNLKRTSSKKDAI